MKPTLTETITNNNEEIEVAGTDEELLTSHLAVFRVIDDLTIQRSFVVADNHRRRDNSDKQQIDIDVNWWFIRRLKEAKHQSKNVKSKNVKSLLQTRFADFDEPVIENMKY